MPLRFLPPALVVAASLLVAAPVSAGSTPPIAAPPPPAAAPKSKNRADELFDQGTAAFDAGRWSEAKTKFEQAWALKQTHDIAGNLGIAEVQLGKFRDAAEHLTWALDHLPPTESSSTRKGLEQELQKARAQVGVLKLRLNVEGATVVVNGGSIGVLPATKEIFVDPGAVSVTAQREGYVAVKQSVTVPKGEAREMSLVLVPATESSGKRSVVPGLVLGGAGVVALGAGIGLMAAFAAKKSDGEQLGQTIQSAGGSCNAPAGDVATQCNQLHSLSKEGATFNRAGIGTMIGGGVLLAAAGTYLLWPSADPKPRAGFTVVPTATLGGGGLLVLGSF